MRQFAVRRQGDVGEMKLFMITGTCGAGKSTIKDELMARLDPERYACIDSDETGLNWWDYAGTERIHCPERLEKPKGGTSSLYPVWLRTIMSRRLKCRKD